jgi:hypothetical protein
MPKKTPITPPKRMQLPLVWHVPDDIVSRFATNAVIQSIEDAFKISFFEAKPEMRLQPGIKPPVSVKADCVASIIVTPQKLQSIIQALQRHLDSFNELNKKQAKP